MSTLTSGGVHCDTCGGGCVLAPSLRVVRARQDKGFPEVPTVLSGFYGRFVKVTHTLSDAMDDYEGYGSVSEDTEEGSDMNEDEGRMAPGPVVKAGMELLIKIEQMHLRPEVAKAFQQAIVGVSAMEPADAFDSPYWKAEREKDQGGDEVADDLGPFLYNVEQGCDACGDSGVAYWSDDIYGDCRECVWHPWARAWSGVETAVAMAKRVLSRREGAS